MGEEATANAFSILVSMQYYIFLVSQPDSSCFLITQVPCQVSWHKHVHEAGNTTNTGFTSSPYTRFTTLCYTTNDIFVTHLKLHCFVLREISNKPEKKKNLRMQLLKLAWTGRAEKEPEGIDSAQLYVGMHQTMPAGDAFNSLPSCMSHKQHTSPVLKKPSCTKTS